MYFIQLFRYVTLLGNKAGRKTIFFISEKNYERNGKKTRGKVFYFSCKIRSHDYMTTCGKRGCVSSCFFCHNCSKLKKIAPYFSAIDTFNSIMQAITTASTTCYAPTTCYVSIVARSLVFLIKVDINLVKIFRMRKIAT